MEVLLGIIVLFVALLAVITLAIWAHVSIGKIASGGCRSARETLKEISLVRKKNSK